jgi:hypothetical protein
MGLFNFGFFKRIGFYFSVASIVTLVAAMLSYVNGFTDTLLEYNNSNVLGIGFIGIGAFAVLLLIDFTSNYAPLALWLGCFASFLTYISNIYMYFTGVFYNGVSLEAFGLIDPIVLTSTILYVVSFVLANLAMYMRHSDEGGF